MRVPPVTALLLALSLTGAACSGTDSASTPDTAAGVVPATGSGPEDSSTTGLDAGPASTSVTTITTSTAAPTTEPPPSSDLPVIDACITQRRPDIGVQSGALESGGNQYTVQWLIPSSYDGTALPLVLDFHGIGSNGAQQAVLSAFGGLAESAGFVLAQPTGVATTLDDRNSWELPQFDTEERDDIAFVVDLIDFLRAEACIDQSRVFATGMANGGFFTSVVVCRLADRIAAAMSVAGVTHPDDCDPARPVPYLAFHGTGDTVVPYDPGGASALGDGSSSAFFEQVMPDEFAEFAADFGCTAFEDRAVTGDVTLRSWSGCDADTELGFYTIDGGGHTWPGSAMSAAIPSLGPTNLDVDATALAWEFFSRHSLEPVE